MARVRLLCAITAALAVVLGFVVVPPAAAIGCGDGSLAFSGGDGSAGSPFLIGSEADLIALREGFTQTPSYYSSACSYRQIADITLSSPWSHGLGLSSNAAGYKPFDAVYDGQSHAITNLAIDAQAVVGASQAAELGFVGLSTAGTAVIRNLALVNATVTCGSLTSYAALLVSETSGTVERSSATGTVNCGAADALARMGGLIGETGGTVMNAWASGTITVPTTSVFPPNSVGGAVGKTLSGASIVNVLSRVTVVNGGSADWPGAFIGNKNGTVQGSFAQSGLSSGLSQLFGNNPSATGVAFKTAAELQDLSTYGGWSIVEGSSASSIWGISPSLNGGFPFLQAVVADADGAPPPPVLQQVPIAADGSCMRVEDRALGYNTGLVGGWSRSWAQWPNGGAGGSVCTRTLAHVGGRWVISA